MGKEVKSLPVYLVKAKSYPKGSPKRGVAVDLIEFEWRS